MVVYYYHAELPWKWINQTTRMPRLLTTQGRLLTSTCDQPSKTRPYKPVIHYMKEAVQPNMSVTPSNATQNDDHLVTRQEHIMAQFPDVFQGVGKIPGEPYRIQLDPQVSSKQTPCRPVPVHLKQAFKAEIDKMLEAGVLKPVHEATSWINSFMLVEGNDQHGQHKLRICLDPTNLNKAIVHEPYHLRPRGHSTPTSRCYNTYSSGL